MNRDAPRSTRGPVPLPPRMTAVLEQYRKRVWVIKLAEGALAAIFGLVMSYLVVFGLDRLFDTPAMLRALILAAGGVGMVILFPLKYHNWVWSHRRLDQVARLLRHKFPRFGDHLLGIVELAQAESQEGTSRALVEAAMRQVDAEMEDRDLADAVPRPRHRRWAWIAGVPIAAIVVVVLWVPAAGGNALARWLLPFGDVERYTFAQLDGETGSRVVPYAEPFTVEAHLKDDSPWKPASGRAWYAEQPPIDVARDGTTYRFGIPPQVADGNVSMRIGDARRAIAVEPKMRPALTAIAAQVRLPAYLQRNEPLVEDVRGGLISLVKGSAAVFEATATRELATATLDERPQSVDGAVVTTESIAVDASAEYRLAWRDRFGLAVREPQVLRVEAVDDEAPTVAVDKLATHEVVLSDAVVAFEIHAGDDFGVQKIGLEWEGIEHPVHNPEPSSGEKIVAAGAPTEDSMTVAATFSAECEKVRPQSLRLRAFAEDYLPGRERAVSPYVVLHVLTPAQHLEWLADQMSQWAGAAKEVYEKELQLHETNEELLNLPPEELDEPAQKKKIQEQAAAEKANAAKLGALIDIGKELLGEAAKNEEFDADQLDSLADLLAQLEEIAGEKMPSVAELLEDAAAAAGQPTPPSDEPPLPGEQGTSKPPEKPDDGPGEDPLSAPPGADDLGLEKVDKYGPEGLEPQGLDEAPDDPNKEAADAAVDRGEPPEGDPGYIPANPTPLVVDVESGFNEPEKAEDAPQVVGGLLPPGTILKGSGRDEDEGEEKPASTAELVLKAVTEQQELLDAFAKLAGEINALLIGLENSTFVKRLKAASRRQIDLAVELNDLDGFGEDETFAKNREERKRLANREIAESETILTLQEDLDAYADRKPSKNYSRVLDEMRAGEVVDEMRDVAATVTENAIGQATIEAEFWADTLDRWAEQLVDPLGPAGPPPAFVELPSLTPEIVLEVVRLIDREMNLREETRELHQARDALEDETYEERGRELSETQAELAAKSRELAVEIRDLPVADVLDSEDPADELKRNILTHQIEKLSKAAVVMDEVEGLLARPTTGPETIAAISEVIEILLETHRLPNAPMVVKAPPATLPAMLLAGFGGDGGKAFIEKRAPGQATGKTGRVLPEEFRQGLDVYFETLEGRPLEASRE